MLSTYEMRKNSVKLQQEGTTLQILTNYTTSLTAKAETNEKLDDKTCQTTMGKC